MSTRRILAALAAAPLVAAAVTLAAVVATGAHRRLGVSRARARASLSSDGLLAGANVQNDRAVQIAAPPEAVWPWLVQLGQDKAGFYSFEFVENLAGCQIQGVDRIRPEWQHLQVGDPLRLHPEVSLRIAQLEPAVVLAASSAGGQAPGEAGFDMTWAFHLQPVPGESGATPATRLHIRERYGTQGATARAMIEAISLISTVMTWRMLSRISTLATTNAPSARHRP